MAQIILKHEKNDDGSVNAHLKCPPLKGKAPSEMVAAELEYLIKSLPVSDAYKERLRVLIGAYGVLKAIGE